MDYRYRRRKQFNPEFRNLQANLLAMRLRSLMLVCFLFCGRLHGQEWNATVPKDVVIIQSTKDYHAALKTAKDAATRLGKKLDLEENHPNKKLGLSLSKSDCEGSAYDYPCYTARGEGGTENSNYVSIEYSTAYNGFKKGYYIVVTAIADPGSAQSHKEVTAARSWYKDAYAKRTRIWHGCLH